MSSIGKRSWTFHVVILVHSKSNDQLLPKLFTNIHLKSFHRVLTAKKVARIQRSLKWPCQVQEGHAWTPDKKVCINFQMHTSKNFSYGVNLECRFNIFAMGFPPFNFNSLFDNRVLDINIWLIQDFSLKNTYFSWK